MKGSAKKVTVDERGRITLPPEVRGSADTFLIEKKKDGTISLVPQKTVSPDEALLVETLKKSVNQMKRGRKEPLPDEWIEK